MTVAAGDSSSSKSSKSNKALKFKTSRTLSEAHVRQIEVLKVLCERGHGTKRQVEITEIADLCGVRDEKEVQRHLLILEGQKLVTPFPEGDFTSTRWQITRHGVKTMRTIEDSVLQ